jgi:hypothetical protein
VAALPQEAGPGASGLGNDAPGRAKIGAALSVADATQLGFKPVIGHGCNPQGGTDFEWKCFAAREFQDAQFRTLFLNDLEWSLRRGALGCAMRSEQYQ